MVAAWAWEWIVHGALVWTGLSLFGLAFNWITWRRTTDQWAAMRARHPYLCTVIVFSRAVLPHLRKVPRVAVYMPPVTDTEKDPFLEAKELAARLAVEPPVTLRESVPTIVAPPSIVVALPQQPPPSPPDFDPERTKEGPTAP